MYIVAVYQRRNFTFLAPAAEHKSLLRRQVLTLAPRRYVEWDESKGFAYLALGRPACRAMLTVANGLGLVPRV